MSRPTVPGLHQGGFLRGGRRADNSEAAARAAIEQVGSVRAPGALSPVGPLNWCWPWGNPHPIASGSSPFSAVNFNNVFQYSGYDKLQAWPAVFGRNVRVTSVAISQLTASGLSVEHQINLGIYSGDIYPGARLWWGNLRLFTQAGVQGVDIPWNWGNAVAGAAFADLTGGAGVGGLELEAGIVYWMAMVYKQQLITDSVTTTGFHAVQLGAPLLGERFKANSTGAPNNTWIGVATPNPVVGFGHDFVFADMPATFPSSAPVDLLLNNGGISNMPAIWTAIEYA